MRRELDAILSVQRFFAATLPDEWEIRRKVEDGAEPERPYALVEMPGDATSEGGRDVREVSMVFAANLYLEAPADRRRDAAEEAALAVREIVWRAVNHGPDPRHPTPDLIPLYSYEPRCAVQRLRVRGAIAGEWTVDAGAGPSSPIAFDADTAEVEAAVHEAVLGDNAIVVKRGNGVFDVVFVNDLAGEDVSLLVVDDSALVGVEATVVEILTGTPAPWRARADFLRVTDFSMRTLPDEDTPELMHVAVNLRCAFARTLAVPFDQMLLQSIYATGGSGGV